MVEKIIVLEHIPLPDFLGVENANIRELAEAFPESKIVSRGNEIIIRGQPPEILRINEIINGLIDYYHQFGPLDRDVVRRFINEEEQSPANNGGETPGNEVIVYGTRGGPIKPKTSNQRELVDLVQNKDLVFATGPAGTGKTYISVALAVQALKNKRVKKIIITRPAVEAGEHLGFLPGDMQEKIDPYLRPIYDALDDMVPPEKLRYYQENRVIEIAPLAYMRGRTLNNAFILLDEAQNTTPNQIKMFLTRMGPKSKIIITGDYSQVDLPRNQKSGLTQAIDILKAIKGIGFLRLDPTDVVRHALVRDIIKAYDQAEQDQAQGKQGDFKF